MRLQICFADHQLRAEGKIRNIGIPAQPMYVFGEEQSERGKNEIVSGQFLNNDFVFRRKLSGVGESFQPVV